MLAHYLKLGFLLRARNWKSPFSEIDLVLKSPDGETVLVEVKSVTSFEFLHQRIKRTQAIRLKRALVFACERFPPARIELAVVSQNNEVQVFPEFLESFFY